MTIQVKVHRRPDGGWQYRCGRTVNGLYWLALGCQHVSPREANKHADILAGRYDTPLSPSSDPAASRTAGEPDGGFSGSPERLPAPGVPAAASTSLGAAAPDLTLFGPSRA